VKSILDSRDVNNLQRVQEQSPTAGPTSGPGFEGVSTFRFVSRGVNFGIARGSGGGIGIPVHDGCLQIAKHVMRVSSTNHAVEAPPQAATFMRRLWNVLESRFEASSESMTGDLRGFPQVRRMCAPQYYQMSWLLLPKWEDHELAQTEV
jgi:hypothetical protein